MLHRGQARGRNFRFGPSLEARIPKPYTLNPAPYEFMSVGFRVYMVSVLGFRVYDFGFRVLGFIIGFRVKGPAYEHPAAGPRRQNVEPFL